MQNRDVKYAFERAVYEKLYVKCCVNSKFLPLMQPWVDSGFVGLETYTSVK